MSSEVMFVCESVTERESEIEMCTTQVMLSCHWLPDRLGQFEY